MITLVKISVVLVMVAALLAGCNRPGPGRLHVVYILDLTASTIEEARTKAFDSVKEPFDKGLVKRGDSITVIPITGDALIESQGTILRYDIPTDREVFDDDLRRLSEQVVTDLQKMQDASAAKPYLYSDILGAVKIANEEFAADQADVHKVLIIMSDFVEDEKRLNFKSSPLVANEKSATESAKKLALKDPTLNGAKVYLGWLQSRDLKNIPADRRDAIRSFWTEYFNQAGVKSIHVSSDGPGQLTKFFALNDSLSAS